MSKFLKSLTNNQRSLGMALIVSLMIALGGALIYAFPSASNQWYAPVQPIPFSHKLHAGDKKIDCRYCHIGVDKSKHASVPALNVCMNCHKVVKTDSPHIQKLTKAYNEGRPIEWIRVHELPDFVAFNHKPHVEAGVSCETCHGDVKNMDILFQASPLTMGWCMNCHRGDTTPREVLQKFHPDVEDPKGLPVAPVNCSTCHY
jgi:hypothetical protein